MFTKMWGTWTVAGGRQAWVLKKITTLGLVGGIFHPANGFYIPWQHLSVLKSLFHEMAQALAVLSIVLKREQTRPGQWGQQLRTFQSCLSTVALSLSSDTPTTPEPPHSSTSLGTMTNMGRAVLPCSRTGLQQFLLLQSLGRKGSSIFILTALLGEIPPRPDLHPSQRDMVTLEDLWDRSVTAPRL